MVVKIKHIKLQPDPKLQALKALVRVCKKHNISIQANNDILHIAGYRLNGLSGDGAQVLVAEVVTQVIK